VGVFAVKECAYCGKPFPAFKDGKRKFCSRQCKYRYHSVRYWRKRCLHDFYFRQKSLERLKAWKEKKKQERLQQKESGEKQVVADIFWV